MTLTEWVVWRQVVMQGEYERMKIMECILKKLIEVEG